jgi:N-acyl-L-homoserine lactone synthetase
MIVVIEKYNDHKYPTLLDQMFRMRARVFHERLNWQVAVEDGKERDKFDDMDPVYLVYADRGGAVAKGSLRLLPTTGPTVLAEFFADTVPAGVQIAAPTIWECTRFCLNEDVVDRFDRQEVKFASLKLLIGLGKVAAKAGVQSIVGNFDAGMLRLYRQVGCQVDVLGSTRRFGEAVFLGSFEVSSRVISKLEAKLSDYYSRDGHDLLRLVA